MIACSYQLHCQISYQVSFCPTPNRVNILMPQRFSLHIDVQTHFILRWMCHKGSVCLTLNKMCVEALKYIPIFDIPFLMNQCDVNMFHKAVTVFPALTFYPCNHCDCPNDASVRLSSSCHFLPAWLPTGETQASGVVLKVELGPCLINDWHLCQSIHSAATACNKSHLAGRWADPQGSPESMTSDKHGCLADYQTNTSLRSIKQPDPSLITVLYIKMTSDITQPKIKARSPR